MELELHFDFGSPNAYLAHKVLPEIEARTGQAFGYVPILLGGVFKATNNTSPMESLRGIRNKGEYQNSETERFLRRHQITDFQRNPHFPVNTLKIMRGAVYARGTDFYGRYVDEVFRHMWAQPKKMDDPAVIRDALLDSQLPADEILEAIERDAVKQQLITNTEVSVARGNFGSPTFFVGDEMFFGKDRLREVEEEIEAQRA